MRQLLTLAVVLVVPSVSFAQMPGGYTPDLTGKWSGYWVSDKNGHNGPLNATFKPRGCDAYRVTFSGRFAKVIPFRYSTTMQIVGGGEGVVMLSAERPLGPRGTYRTTALATGSNFAATSTSPRDHGRFVMTRR